MTEAGWLACDGPRPMLTFLRDWASDRKMRLFGCACYRSLWVRFSSDWRGTELVDAAEAYADGAIGKQAFKLIRKRVETFEGPRVSGVAWEAAARSSQHCLGEIFPPPGRPVVRERPEELPVHVALLRDIFGNPFRPATLDRAWLTSTVTALASQMYESRDFTAMPILADALQDAGCDSEDVLGHCRGPGPHVRGCWVVDLVLGKE
jgi:hypothetical protein